MGNGNNLKIPAYFILGAVRVLMQYVGRNMSQNWLTIFGISFIFLMTMLGSAVVFFFKGEISKKPQAFFLGLASGVMISASVWSLLLPALDLFRFNFNALAFLPAVMAVAFGGVFLVLLDGILLVLLKKKVEKNTSVNKPFRLFLAVTFHNIPEGLAVGFAFGVANMLNDPSLFVGALGLALGIGIQNFPEGMAVALPMKSALKSNKKAFFWGTCSGMAEPIFAVLGYILAFKLQILQPWLLCASAGAMLFVSAEDLIPDSKLPDNPKIGAWGVLIGFLVMMALDVGLG